MNWINILIGHGKDLNSLQMCVRAIIVFFITLALLRIAGVRTFGKKSAFDTVIIIMLGSVLSRVVVGASPFIPTILSCFVFVIIHWLLGKISFHNDMIGKLIKGEEHSLYENGIENYKNMRKTQISKKDLSESIRLTINEDGMENVKEIFIERNGEVSVIKK